MNYELQSELQFQVRKDVVYIFSIDKAKDFVEKLNSLPEKEIGFFQVWTALKKKSLLYKDEQHGEICDYEVVFCLQTDFKDEHIHLKIEAEKESLFYYPFFEDDKRMINYFFDLPENQPEEFKEYMQSISKSES